MLSNQLYRVLSNQELQVYYQPQVSLHTGKIVGVEALLRWFHPTLGLINPAEFIPIAEQTGLINPIGAWVLETACKQNVAWRRMGFQDIRMAVNLSVVQLRNTGLAAQVKRIITETGIDPKQLELEVTESATTREPDYIVSVLNELKKLGLSISIDDFGTEYSSLNRLKTLPIDRLKMDIQFVHGIDKSPKDQAITTVIINLAKNLDLKLVAEGVESPTQLSFLKQRMCDEVQGFYYYKPMPPHEIDKILVGTSSAATEYVQMLPEGATAAVLM
jgi:EAL domain-containing protein (putative c-di-GMP-specific phosphodiesterase class I)